MSEISWKEIIQYCHTMSEKTENTIKPNNDGDHLMERKEITFPYEIFSST